MKIRYFSDTDTLYFDLKDEPSSRTEVLTDNLIIDFDATDQVVGITLEHASVAIDLSGVETIDLPETAANSKTTT